MTIVPVVQFPPTESWHPILNGWMITALGVEFSQIINTMKTKIFWFVFLILSASLLVKCDKDDDTTILTLTIASVKPVTNEYTVQHLPFITPPLYIYKENGDEWGIWPSSNPIHGFDNIYQEGSEYVIEIIETCKDNPEPDQPNYSYRLNRVVSAVHKESENIPNYMIK